MKINTKKMVILALLSAISIVLVELVPRIPWPGAAFLEYDPADITIILATLIYGPLSGFIVTVVVSVIQGLTVSGGSGVIGILMHIFATGTYVIITGNVRVNKNTFGVIFSVLLGAIAMTVSMIIWNMIFTPLFMNQPFEVVKGMIIPIILPFNIVKATVNGALAIIIYLMLKNQKRCIFYIFFYIMKIL